MDGIDERILSELTRDGRATLQEIADRVGLRRPSVHARVKALEASGVLRGYRADVDPSAVGASLLAYVLLGVAHGKGQDCMATASRLATALRAIPQVVECHTLAGDDDMIVKVRAADIRELEEVVTRRISGLAGVERVRTRIGLSSHFERPVAVRSITPRAPSRRAARRSRART